MGAHIWKYTRSSHCIDTVKEGNKIKEPKWARGSEEKNEVETVGAEKYATTEQKKRKNIFRTPSKS